MARPRGYGTDVMCGGAGLHGPPVETGTGAVQLQLTVAATDGYGIVMAISFDVPLTPQAETPRTRTK
jgi:hypothetical protein